MKRWICFWMVLLLAFSLCPVAAAERGKYCTLCNTNEAILDARAMKADSERNFYVRQTGTSDPFPVYDTSRNAYGTVVSDGIYFAASATGRKSAAYHDSHTVQPDAYDKLGIFPNDGVYEGSAGLQVSGRWTPSSRGTPLAPGRLLPARRTGKEGKSVRGLLLCILTLCLTLPVARAETMEYREGIVTISAEVEAPAEVTEARELVCGVLSLADQELLRLFGLPEDAEVKRTSDEYGLQSYSCTSGEETASCSQSLHYSYRRGSYALLRGYTRSSDYAGEAPTPEESELFRNLAQVGIELAVRRRGSQTTEAVWDDLGRQQEDLEWEKDKSGLELLPEDLPQGERVCRYECVQVLEGIPCFQFSREIPGMDSFTFECETTLYTVGGALACFDGGVYSAPKEYGEYAPLITAGEAARAFAAERNLLLGVQGVFCDRIRLEYMRTEEPGQLIYDCWRLVPVWVFYEGERVLGGVHALTGEVLAL